MKLFVGNLPWKATEESLREFFAKVGEVVSVKIVSDPYTGKSKGFGFVEFKNREEATRAIQEFDNQEYMGRPLKVSEARERSEQRGPGNRSNNSMRMDRSEYMV